MRLGNLPNPRLHMVKPFLYYWPLLLLFSHSYQVMTFYSLETELFASYSCRVTLGRECKVGKGSEPSQTMFSSMPPPPCPPTTQLQGVARGYACCQLELWNGGKRKAQPNNVWKPLAPCSEKWSAAQGLMQLQWLHWCNAGSSTTVLLCSSYGWVQMCHNIFTSWQEKTNDWLIKRL